MALLLKREGLWKQSEIALPEKGGGEWVKTKLYNFHNASKTAG